MNVSLKSPQEIAMMREGGKITAYVLSQLQKTIEPGITTKELDALAVTLLEQKGGIASFKDFKGYPFSLVICLNDEVVHGMPSDRKIAVGDLLTLDFGTYYKGFHTDSAVTVEVGSTHSQQFLLSGQEALTNAIQACQVGNRIGDIGYAIDSVISRDGYDVVWQFVGHGVGRELHEDPDIPGYGEPKTGIQLREGMVLAVEVMYAQGSGEVKILDDGWTAVTVDGSKSGMFEHSVAITAHGPLILTAE